MFVGVFRKVWEFHRPGFFFPICNFFFLSFFFFLNGLTVDRPLCLHVDVLGEFPTLKNEESILFAEALISFLDVRC